MKKLFFITLLMILLISMVSAEGIQNQEYNLKLSCEGYTCSSINITIFYPDSTIFINNEQMEDNSYYANYSFTPTENGEYLYFYSDGTNSSEGILKVSPTGNDIDTAEGIIYFMVLVILFFLLSICTYGAFSIQGENVKNNDQEIIQVNWKKYLKIFCIAMAYTFFIMVIWFIWNLVYAYSDWYQLNNIFHLLFRILYAAIIPLVLVISVYSIAKFKDDKKINEFIKRMGIPYKSL